MGCDFLSHGYCLSLGVLMIPVCLALQSMLFLYMNFFSQKLYMFGNGVMLISNPVQLK